MHGNKQSPGDVLPDNFTNLDEFLEFWDTHSSADFEQSMETVAVEVELTSSKAYMPVAKDLLSKVRAQARRQGVSSETLVNLWLQERLTAAG
jgi:hypothetical protein